MNLRSIGVCSSEAADLCEFFQQLAQALGADTRVLFERKEGRQMALYVLPDRFVHYLCTLCCPAAILLIFAIFLLISAHLCSSLHIFTRLH